MYKSSKQNVKDGSTCELQAQTYNMCGHLKTAAQIRDASKCQQVSVKKSITILSMVVWEALNEYIATKGNVGDL